MNHEYSTLFQCKDKEASTLNCILPVMMNTHCRSWKWICDLCPSVSWIRGISKWKSQICARASTMTPDLCKQIQNCKNWQKLEKNLLLKVSQLTVFLCFYKNAFVKAFLLFSEAKTLFKTGWFSSGYPCSESILSDFSTLALSDGTLIAAN